MTAPKRVRLSRAKGWRKPEGAVVVSRPSAWSNPWRVVWADCTAAAGTMCWSVVHTDGTLRQTHLNDKPAAVKVAVTAYVMDWMNDPIRLARAGLAVEQLGGRDLACWCPLDQPCHADVLLDIANPGTAP